MLCVVRDKTRVCLDIVGWTPRVLKETQVHRKRSLYLLNQTLRKACFNCVLYSPSRRDSTVSRGHSQAGVSETCGKRVQGIISAKKNICARACAPMQRCTSFFVIKLLQSYLESCASIVQAVVCRPPSRLPNVCLD